MPAFNVKVISGQKAPAPVRHTQPGGVWKKIFCSMKVADWFEVPPGKDKGVKSAANTLMKGRYTCYQHPTKRGYHIFQRTK